MPLQCSDIARPTATQRRPIRQLERNLPCVHAINFRWTRECAHQDAGLAAISPRPPNERLKSATTIRYCAPPLSFAKRAGGPGALAVIVKIAPRGGGAKSSPRWAWHYAVSVTSLASKASLILRLSVSNVLVCKVGCTRMTSSRLAISWAPCTTTAASGSRVLTAASAVLLTAASAACLIAGVGNVTGDTDLEREASDLTDGGGRRRLSLLLCLVR